LDIWAISIDDWDGHVRNPIDTFKSWPVDSAEGIDEVPERRDDTVATPADA
jgi:hypothetical protein